MRRNEWGQDPSKRPRRGRWSQAEIARLRELYGTRDDKAIAKELNRSVQSIRRVAEQLFPLGVRKGPWEPEEDERLKELLGGTTREVIARVLGRTPEEVAQRARELAVVQRSDPWTADEVARLKRIYGTRTDADLAIIFGRPVEAIRRKAKSLRLAKDKAFLRRIAGAPSTRMPRWSREEVEILRELYPTHSNLDIAQRLDRSVKSVVSKAHNLGLKKSVERLQEMGRQNVGLRYWRRHGSSEALQAPHRSRGDTAKAEGGQARSKRVSGREESGSERAD